MIANLRELARTCANLREIIYKMKKKKYPRIAPKYRLDKNGKRKEVYLEYDVFISIFEEISDLEKKIEKLNINPGDK